MEEREIKADLGQGVEWAEKITDEELRKIYNNDLSEAS